MKRLTTDTPKNNLQASLNLFYIKNHETWVRGGGPEPDFEDVNLSDFIRDVAKKHFPDIEMPESNDDLIFAMAEWLMDGVDEPTGVLALLYTSAWTYSELRRKLMQYEDTGLEPEEVKNALDVNDIMPEINVTADHLRDLVQAEQDGRLVELPCKVVDTIDKLFSHNEIITLWYDKPGDKDHSYLLWRGEAWKLPDEYKGQMVLKFKGIIPEKISEADTINLQITPREDMELTGKESATPDAPEKPEEPEWKGRVMRTFLGGR